MQIPLCNNIKHDLLKLALDFKIYTDTQNLILVTQKKQLDYRHYEMMNCKKIKKNTPRDVSIIQDTQVNVLKRFQQ